MTEAEQERAEIEGPAQPTRRRRVVRRLLIGIAVTVVGLILLGVALYNFGGMWLPRRDLRAQYDQLLAAGQVPPVDNRFVIPIPGCVCHSDDPYLTMQHSERRIRECSGCHDGARAAN